MHNRITFSIAYLKSIFKTPWFQFGKMRKFAGSVSDLLFLSCGPSPGGNLVYVEFSLSGATQPGNLIIRSIAEYVSGRLNKPNIFQRMNQMSLKNKSKCSPDTVSLMLPRQNLDKREITRSNNKLFLQGYVIPFLYDKYYYL